MGRKIIPVLFLLFLLISVFLSIELKKSKGELNDFQRESESLIIQKQENFYANAWYRELLYLNISNNGKVASIPLAQAPKKVRLTSLLPVVFLKNGFCTSCVKDVLPNLIDKLNQSGEFIVVSHANNNAVIETMLSEGDINHRVIWHDDYLYGRYNIEYDAELLFIDQQNRIAGIIPLEYLKLEGLFDELLKRFLAAE